MIKIKRILFPTDFSEPAREAQKYAMAMADEFGSQLHLLHVVPLLIPFPDASAPFVVPEGEMQAQVDAAENRLIGELDPEWVKKHDVVTTAIMGVAIDEISRYVNENQIDLLVLGTHGHTGLVHLFMGSVAENLVRTANCAVLTVRPRPDSSSSAT